MGRLATRQTGTWRRRDMRKTNSLIAPGHASASIQMRGPGGRSPDSLLTFLHLANSYCYAGSAGRRFRQGHDRIKPWLRAHNARDVALACQVFGEEHVPWTNARHRPISYLDFGSPR
jgi:hypothetical protein